MYEVGTSWVEGIEQKCSLHIRKWLKLPKKNISKQRYTVRKDNLLYQFHLFLNCIKLEKPKPLMILQYSNDEKISENPPEVRTYRKWKAENEVYNAISNLKFQDLLRVTQTGRSGLGTRKCKPFGLSNDVMLL